MLADNRPVQKARRVGGFGRLGWCQHLRHLTPAAGASERARQSRRFARLAGRARNKLSVNAGFECPIIALTVVTGMAVLGQPDGAGAVSQAVPAQSLLAAIELRLGLGYVKCTPEIPLGDVTSVVGADDVVVRTGPR